MPSQTERACAGRAGPLTETVSRRKVRASHARFSDVGWPVFYAAVDRTTAGQEVAHHYGRTAAGDAAFARAVYYSIVRCRLALRLARHFAKLCNLLSMGGGSAVCGRFFHLKAAAIAASLGCGSGYKRGCSSRSN